MLFAIAIGEYEEGIVSSHRVTSDNVSIRIVVNILADSIDRYINTINALMLDGASTPPLIRPIIVRHNPPKVSWHPDKVIGLYIFVLFLLNIVPTAAQRDAINNNPSPFSENIPIPAVSPSVDKEVVLLRGTFLKLITIIPIKLSRQPKSLIMDGFSDLYTIKASSTVNMVPLELIIEPLTPVALDKPI